ncbi:DUF3626 domain-containing protein [Streptomyces sp. GC420]|uniref:DUF3626 domain-containing protein n=1 Tax=Streptomyces sp. GC420 TaxID=2697568 RepID=UPI001414DAC1|nr:DUF3626 domain-containing protein [Streptomyces sp. GC420]NBM20234.1 DUF3626 domain-containing protein [Streptomyces sp. GC420]
MTPPPVRLTAAQTAALAHVRATARDRHDEALARLGRLSGPSPGQEELCALVREHGRITLNFHPDRLLPGGLTVAESLARDGRYRSQYETGVSNGGLSAYPGGDRDRWEEALFGAAYHTAGVAAGDRPKYGGLNLRGHPDGACPRFGSCHVRLRPQVNERATFTLGDSHLGPKDTGTADTFLCVLAGLSECAAEEGWKNGVAGPDLAGTIRALPHAAIRTEHGRALDHYIEAQVHGTIDLARDAEALVLDPSFAGTDAGALLEGTAARLGIALERHPGFALDPADVDEEFRGPAIPPLAALVSRDYADGGPVTAHAIGLAAADRTGAGPETLQHLKQLWHTTVNRGRPALR